MASGIDQAKTNGIVLMKKVVSGIGHVKVKTNRIVLKKRTTSGIVVMMSVDHDLTRMNG